MPDVKELYELVTKQRPPDTGAFERQRTRQIRTTRNRKVGAFAVVAAIGVAAAAVILGTPRSSEPKREVGGRPPVSPVEVATSFVEAYGALDVDTVIGLLGDDADISPLIDWVNLRPGGPLEELRMTFSLLEAQGYSHTRDSCEEVSRSASNTSLRCTFELHWLHSDEIGRGPFAGSYFDITVRDGEITRVSNYVEIEEFSPQMWEPFAAWVSTNHPRDVLDMYEDETQSLERVTEESIRLWDRYTRDYVEEVNQGVIG